MTLTPLFGTGQLRIAGTGLYSASKPPDHEKKTVNFMPARPVTGCAPVKISWPHAADHSRNRPLLTVIAGRANLLARFPPGQEQLCTFHVYLSGQQAGPALAQIGAFPASSPAINAAGAVSNPYFGAAGRRIQARIPCCGN